MNRPKWCIVVLKMTISDANLVVYKYNKSAVTIGYPQTIFRTRYGASTLSLVG